MDTIENIWNSQKNKEIEKWVRPNNCGLLCKNIRVNLTMQKINDSNNRTSLYKNETEVKEYLNKHPDDPLDINFVG